MAVTTGFLPRGALWPEAHHGRGLAAEPGRRIALDLNSPSAAMIDKVEQIKASIRAKVERPYRVIKRQSAQMTTRCRALKANTAHHNNLFAMASLRMASKNTEYWMGKSA